MGKSRLLEELSKGGLRRLSARRLISAPDASRLVEGDTRVLIDALDETPAFAEGGVVDQVVATLEHAGIVQFAIACRAEDWQASTARSIITEIFGNPPLELRLRPFGERQITDFLADELGPERASHVVQTYQKRGFGEWLGNPQTLIMLAAVAKSGELPQTTSALFETYINLSLPEANPLRRQQRREIPRQAALDTLGAAFAALILSGKSALAKAAADFFEEDLRLSELGRLPGFSDWTGVSGNRLVKMYGGDSDRLTYAHRRIGEWLGAQWLARYADSERVRARLFASFTVRGIVPASLRGLFAWLSLDSKLSLRVIATDPMAVIEYGDADVLHDREARALLDALEALSVQDPWFAGWGDFRAKALVRAGLLPETLSAVLDAGRAARLRLLLVRQFHGETLEPNISRKLMQLALDEDTFYALREDAAKTLVGNLSSAEMANFAEDLRCQGSHDATRLAALIILQAGIENFENEQVVETIFAACGHSISAVPAEGEDPMAARAWGYRQGIPDARLDAVLDLIADYAIALLPKHRSLESADIINLGDALIARRLRLGPVEPIRLLRWLEAFSGRDSYVAEDEKAISLYLRDHGEVRQEIQRIWLGGKNDEDAFFKASYGLTRIHKDLEFTDDDLAKFLTSVPADFKGWRTAAHLIKHSSTEGRKSRAALGRFFNSNEHYESFISGLIDPPKADWEIEREKRAAFRQANQDRRWADFRKGMAAEQDELEQGRFGVIRQGATVYLGRFSDLRDFRTAQDRLDALCGPQLTSSVLRGLEVYLNILPPYPNAERIAQDYARNRVWNTRHVLVAALAERVKQRGSIEPLTTDQMVAAQLHIAHGTPSGDEWKPLKEAVWTALIARPDAFERYVRLLVEPCLRRKHEIIMGLYDVLHEGRDAHPEMVLRLAQEWLQRFPRMHSRPEAELMDVLLAGREYGAMRALVQRRLRMKTLDQGRRRNWQAAGLICDFERYATKLTILDGDEPLFWAIRERLGARRPYDHALDNVPIRLASWLVEHFRFAFPVEERPPGVTSGDTNTWDATEAMLRLIDRIGSDTSAEAGELLRMLSETRDGYRERIVAVLAEYNRNCAENARATMDVNSLTALLADGPPTSLPDLQAKLLNLLDRVEAQAKSNDTDSWVTFFRDDRRTPHDEEHCRDRVIDMLRQHEWTIQFSPEKHLGDNREGDIACEYGNLHLPIEVKGQWHKDLWKAADEQLAAQQAVDHRAAGHGILLVLWFGANGKNLMGPPRGSSIDTPTDAQGLERSLTAWSKVARNGRVRVRVLDLSRS